MPDEEKPAKPPRPSPSYWRRFLAAIFCCISPQTTRDEETEFHVPPGFYTTFTGEELREVRPISWLNSFLKDGKLHIKNLVDLSRGVSLLRLVEELFEVRLVSTADCAKIETCRERRRRKLEKRAIKTVVRYLWKVKHLGLDGISAFDIYNGNYEAIKRVVLCLSKYFLAYKQRRSQCLPGQDPDLIYLPPITCLVPGVSAKVERLSGRLTERDVLWDLEHRRIMSNDSLTVNVELVTNIRNEWRFSGINESSYVIRKTVTPKPEVEVDLPKAPVFGEVAVDEGNRGAEVVEPMVEPQSNNFSQRSEPCVSSPKEFIEKLECKVKDEFPKAPAFEKASCCDKGNRHSEVVELVVDGPMVEQQRSNLSRDSEPCVSSPSSFIDKSDSKEEDELLKAHAPEKATCGKSNRDLEVVEPMIEPQRSNLSRDTEPCVSSPDHGFIGKLECKAEYELPRAHALGEVTTDSGNRDADVVEPQQRSLCQEIEPRVSFPRSVDIKVEDELPKAPILGGMSAGNDDPSTKVVEPIVVGDLQQSNLSGKSEARRDPPLLASSTPLIQETKMGAV